MTRTARPSHRHAPRDDFGELAALGAVAAVTLDGDAANFFGNVATAVADVVDARTVVFGLLDSSGHLVIHPGNFGVPGSSEGSTVACKPSGTGLLEDIVYRGRLHRSRFTRPAETPWRELLGVDVNDALVVGWSAGDDRLGFAAAFDCRSLTGFTEEHARLLQIAAATAGLAWKHKATSDRCELLLERAEALNDSMRAMVNMIVHEFRSPLTVISGYADMLAAGDFGALPHAAEAPLVAMIGKAKELSADVDALLLTARLEAGAIPPAMSRFDLCETVAAATAAAAPLADLGGATIVVEARHRVVTAMANADHVQMILNNLLANALHYGGPHPAIRVVVAADPVPTVTVIDPGGGIPREMRERIFERFVRIVDHTSQPGSGLGLYVSRQLAEHSGGELRLDRSDPATGTAFSLLLRTTAIPVPRGTPDVASDPVHQP